MTGIRVLTEAVEEKHVANRENGLKTFIRDTGGSSLLLTKYQNDARGALNNGYQRLESESARHPEVALKGKLKSNAITEYGKILASGNITINSGNFKNKDSIISGWRFSQCSHCL